MKMLPPMAPTGWLLWSLMSCYYDATALFTRSRAALLLLTSIHCIGKYGDTRDAHFSAVGASLTPWIDFKAQEAYNVPLNDGDYDVEKCDLCMCCHVQLHAETRDGASSWTRCALDLYGTYEKVQSLECNWHFRTDDDAANALAALPWTSW